MPCAPNEDGPGREVSSPRWMVRHCSVALHLLLGRLLGCVSWGPRRRRGEGRRRSHAALGCDIVLAGASEGGSGQAAVLAFCLPFCFAGWVRVVRIVHCVGAIWIPRWYPYFVRRWALTMDMGARGYVFSRY